MYVLMTGDPPLPMDIYSKLTTNLVGSSELEETYKQMMSTPIDFVGEPWGEFPDACDLCEWLLMMDHTQRCASAYDALQHPWFKGLVEQMEHQAVKEARREERRMAERGKAVEPPRLPGQVAAPIPDRLKNSERSDLTLTRVFLFSGA